MQKKMGVSSRLSVHAKRMQNWMVNCIYISYGQKISIVHLREHIYSFMTQSAIFTRFHATAYHCKRVASQGPSGLCVWGKDFL